MATLLLIRHAIAEDRAQWNELGRPDSDRPLTKKGVERFEQAAKGLRLLFPAVDQIVTSPYVRAKETAKLLLAVYPHATLKHSDHLSPEGSLPALGESLKAFDETAWVALVGHEPGLSRLLSHLVRPEGRGRKSRVPLPVFTELKKGGLALVELPPRAEAGSGVLRLLLTPKILRDLGQQGEGSWDT